jgi:hypothetical protein
MIKNAIIQYNTNKVLLILESDLPILTQSPDYVMDITNYQIPIEVDMIYNSDTDNFSFPIKENIVE